MKSLNLVSVLAFAFIASTAAMAQSSPAADGSQQTETPKAYHAGGRHDQHSHEAMLRAQANGQKIEQTTVHAGGRHDQRGHEAAMKADQQRVSGDVSR
jgi:Ni/Co efflux regulator RcnB